MACKEESRDLDKLEASPNSESDSTNRKIHDTIKWVGTDRKTFRTLLDDITRLNDSLLALLEIGREERVPRQTEMAVLDNINVNTAQISGLPDDSEVSAMAQVKSLQDGADSSQLITGGRVRSGLGSRFIMSTIYKESLPA